MNCASALGMVGAKHLVFRMGRAGTCPPPTFLKDFLVKLREVVIKLVTGQSHLAGDDRYSNQFKVACNSQGELHQSIFLSEEGSLRAVLKDKSR